MAVFGEMSETQVEIRTATDLECQNAPARNLWIGRSWRKKSLPKVRMHSGAPKFAFAAGNKLFSGCEIRRPCPVELRGDSDASRSGLSVECVDVPFAIILIFFVREER